MKKKITPGVYPLAPLLCVPPSRRPMSIPLSQFFSFNQAHRLGSDSCCTDQRSIENAAAANYVLQNYWLHDRSLRETQQLATEQPGVFFGGAGGPTAAVIDQHSLLSLGTIQTRPPTRVNLYQRPFATVPYMGRGSVDPLVESHLMQGELLMSKRDPSNSSGEQSTLHYQTVPLIPEVRQRIQNPSTLLESDASSDSWVRGGVPTRELTRDLGPVPASKPTESSFWSSFW
jgi:hypothetical protein